MKLIKFICIIFLLIISSCKDEQIEFIETENNSTTRSLTSDESDTIGRSRKDPINDLSSSNGANLTEDDSDEYFTYVDIGGVEHRIKYDWVISERDDDLDHGELPEGDGDPSWGSIGEPHYFIKSTDILFTNRLIVSQTPLWNESSPIAIVHMALMYYNQFTSPEMLLNRICNKYGSGLNIYSNSFTSTDLKKVVEEYFYCTSYPNIFSSINSGYPVFSACKDVQGYKWLAILIVGYTSTGEYIVYNPSSNWLYEVSPQRIVSGMSFQLLSPK